MKHFLKLFALIVILQSCSSCDVEPVKTRLTYQNIIILSDMSDRISNKNFSNKDLLEIQKLLKYFETKCVKPGEKIGDRSSLYFSTFSDKSSVSINLDDLKTLGEKQSFINSTGKYQKSGLKQKLIDFELVVANKYANTKDFGLDLLSVLIEKISNDNLIKKDKVITNGVDSTIIHYENHIYIFTDGYLEYNTKTKNSQFRFGLPEIRKARMNCISRNLNIEQVIENDPSLSLRPVKKNDHKLVDLHILETHERDFDKAKHTYDNPIGLRDNEILEAVWKKWAVESEFKSIVWSKY